MISNITIFRVIIKKSLFSCLTNCCYDNLILVYFKDRNYKIKMEMKCFNLIAGYSRILKVVILSKKVEPVCFAARFRYSVKVNKICHPLWPFHAMRPRWIPNVAILSNDGQLTRASLFTSTAFQCDDKWLQLMMTYDELWRAVVKSRKSIAGENRSRIKVRLSANY